MCPAVSPRQKPREVSLRGFLPHSTEEIGLRPAGCPCLPPFWQRLHELFLGVIDVLQLMDEQVFMVVMSLVKSPVAVSVQMGNTQAQAFFPAGCALFMFDADWELTGQRKDVPKGLENAVMERMERQKERAERTSLRLKIVKAATYVGHMTGTADEAKRHACQGLHNGPVLAYGFR